MILYSLMGFRIDWYNILALFNVYNFCLSYFPEAAASQAMGNQVVKANQPGTAPLQPKVVASRPLSTILPSSSGTSTTPTPIRPAASISTQTSVATTNVQAGGNARPSSKAKKVGRPPATPNQARTQGPPVAAVAQTPQQQQQQQPQQPQQQPTLLQPVPQQQQQVQQNQQLQQLITQQVLLPPFQDFLWEL